MQYDQVFYNQQCSDNAARRIRLACDGEAIILGVQRVDAWDRATSFETDLYLDEQDREALAQTLRPVKFEPSLTWSEYVAFGAVGGLLVGFVCGALL